MSACGFEPPFQFLEEMIVNVPCCSQRQIDFQVQLCYLLLPTAECKINVPYSCCEYFTTVFKDDFLQVISYCHKSLSLASQTDNANWQLERQCFQLRNTESTSY